MAHGTWHLEPGAYELLAGASSEDIRLRTTVTVDGEPAAPRPVVTHGLNAADFDEQRGTEIVDRTKVSGDAVTPAGGGDGRTALPRLRLRRGCHRGDGGGGGRGERRVLAGRRPGAGDPDARHAHRGLVHYTTLRAAVSAAGVHDVHLRLRGPLRLAHVGFSG